MWHPSHLDVPRGLCRYIHSYQSYIWNHAASHRIQTYGTPFRTRFKKTVLHMKKPRTRSVVYMLLNACIKHVYLKSDTLVYQDCAFLVCSRAPPLCTCPLSHLAGSFSPVKGDLVLREKSTPAPANGHKGESNGTSSVPGGGQGVQGADEEEEEWGAEQPGAQVKVWYTNLHPTVLYCTVQYCRIAMSDRSTAHPSPIASGIHP